MKNKLLIWIIVGVLSVVGVSSCVIGVVANKKDKNKPDTHEHVYASEWSHDETRHWHGATCSHTNEKIDVEEHTNVTDYQISESTDAEMIVKTQLRCIVCGWVSEETALDEYNVIESGNNNYTISETGVYILDGEFNGTSFTIGAEDVSLVGIGAETENITVSFSNNAKNTLIYGLKWKLNSTATQSMNIYGDVSFVKCQFSYFWLTLKTAETKLVFDNNMAVGGGYGIYIGYDETSNNPTAYFTNNTFDSIQLYGIFLNSPFENAEIERFILINNSFINGWGDGALKRSAIKLNVDINLTPIGYDNITDISKLTDSAKEFVRNVLANNTFDKADKVCSYFNLRGNFFDNLDE